MMDVFNPAQRICATLFYNLIAQLDGDERKGAVKALSILVPSTEEGFMIVNDGQMRADFFVQCYDTLLGVALALKMADDDALVPPLEEVPQARASKRLADADAALRRIENAIARAPLASFASN
jgi:hypothetical protein